MNKHYDEFLIEESGPRLDKFLAGHVAGLSRSAAQRLIEAGQVAVNGEPVKASYKIRAGDRVVCQRPAEEPPALQPESIPLDIVYEDQWLLVVDKPAGMVVHPAPG
ncbi:MAG: S4 domain-containing protein, partial [Anaerolineae bacterium]